MPTVFEVVQDAILNKKIAVAMAFFWLSITITIF